MMTWVPLPPQNLRAGWLLTVSNDEAFDDGNGEAFQGDNGTPEGLASN